MVYVNRSVTVTSHIHGRTTTHTCTHACTHRYFIKNIPHTLSFFGCFLFVFLLLEPFKQQLVRLTDYQLFPRYMLILSTGNHWLNLNLVLLLFCCCSVPQVHCAGVGAGAGGAGRASVCPAAAGGPADRTAGGRGPAARLLSHRAGHHCWQLPQPLHAG